MKKKLLAMLLTLCMVTAMVAGLGISAYAADDISADTTVGYIIPYKLASGDTVAKVCQKLGVDFSAKQAEISRINAITDYTKLAVGKVVWIPVTSVGTATDYYTLKAHVVANGDTLAGICAQYGVATGDALLSRLNNATITVGSTLTVPVFKGDTKNAIVTPGSAAPTTPAVSGGTVISTGTTTGAVTTVTGDTVAYYLIPYTMKAGDTVLKVCNTLGIDFAANQNLITRANNITSYSTIPVGRTLLLPCTNVTVSGTCYKVMAHTLVAGDTLYKLCQGYGISYGNNLTLLKALNNSSNLNYVKAGNVVYIPVPSTVTAAAGGAGGVTVVPGTTGVTSTSTSYYTVTKASAKNGSFSLKVAGAEVSAVAAGKTVNVVCNGSDGFIQKDITVVGTQDSSKVVTVSNNTFVMPEFPVTVTATFKQAPKYTLEAKNVGVGLGTYNLFVNNAKLADTSDVAAGTVVTLKVMPAEGYELKKVKIYKTSDPTNPAKAVALSTENTFVMPAYNATVEVEYQISKTYQYQLNADYPDGNGLADFYVNKQVVNHAAAGTKVTVSATPVSGYKFDSLQLEYDVDGVPKQSDKIYTNNFTVPQADEGSAIKVSVSFIKSGTYTITALKAKNGSIGFSVKGSSVGKTEEGRLVQIISKPASGYELDFSQIRIFDKNGADITSSVTYDADECTFYMPAENVKVGFADANTAFIPVTTHQIYTNSDASKGTVEYTVKGVTGATDGVTGSPVLIHITLQPGYRVKSIDVTSKPSDVNKNLKPAVSNNTFTMPGWPVTVNVEYEYEKKTVTIDLGTGDGTLKLVNQTQNYVDIGSGGTAYPGDVISIETTPNAGFRAKKVSVTYVDDDNYVREVAISSNSTFVMPDEDVKVSIVWAEKNYAITKNPVSGGVIAVTDNTTYGEQISSAADGDKIYVKAEANPGYKIKSVYYTNANDKNKQDITSTLVKGYYSFTMPAHAVKIGAEVEEVEYTLTFDTPVHGKLKVSVNGEAAATGDSVKYGDLVTFVTGADDDYVIDELKVFKKGDPNTVVELDGNSFMMPDYNVRIVVKYRALVKDIQMKKTACENGSFVFMKEGIQVEKTGGEFKANEGDTIQIKATPENGYVVDTITVTTIDYGTSVTVIGDSFTMPSVPVKVSVTFKVG